MENLILPKTNHKTNEFLSNYIISENLRDTEFLECTYESVDFTNTDLTNSSTNKCVFNSCLFSGNMCIFNGVESEFIQCEFSNVNLTDSKFNNVKFENCVFNNVTFIRSDLSGISFETSIFYGIVSFQNANLENIQINWRSHAQIGALLYREARNEINNPNRIGLEAYSLWLSQQNEKYCSSLYDPKSNLLPDWFYEWGLNIVSKYYNGTNKELENVLKRENLYNG